jgi:hypothetical protein
MTDRQIIEVLLAELRYVLDTEDIGEVLKTSEEVREQAATRLGHADYAAFCNWCDTGPTPEQVGGCAALVKLA